MEQGKPIRSCGYELNARTVYDVNKAITNQRIIMSSFVDSMVLTMFADYIKTFDNPEETLVATIDGWKTILLDDKKREIAMLEEGNESLMDLAVINDIINDPSFVSFEDDLDKISSDILGILLSQLREGGE